MTDSPETTPAAAAVARLPRHRVPAPHRLSHEGRPAEARAADAGALATPEALGAPARTLARPPALRAARRPALRQRPAAHRPRAQQDPEGRGEPRRADGRATTPTTCPGWDCHGLPIEWKVEEEYRAKGRDKDAVPVLDFRAECRAYAAHWLDVQREEFQRLGVAGDWERPLRHHGLRLRGGDRPRDRRVPDERRPLSRPAPGDVEPGREDRARRSRDRVPRPRLAHALGALPGAARARGRAGPRRRVGRDLDHHALDHPRQPRRRLRRGDRLRAGACGGRGGGHRA